MTIITPTQASFKIVACKPMACYTRDVLRIVKSSTRVDYTGSEPFSATLALHT
jgi:hypothetical protein